MITVTKKLLDRIKTRKGGYTAIQRKVLGCSPAVKGWTKEVIGRQVEHWRILFYERDKNYPNGFVMPKMKSNWDWKRIKTNDLSYQDTWNTRSRFLEGDYGEFLNSDHWRRIKEKTLKKPHYYGQCKFCGCKNGIELHHQTYKFINTQYELKYITPLCREHHQEVHDYAKEEQVSVRIATNKMIEKYCHVKPANV